jgi:hypothetical protein
MILQRLLGSSALGLGLALCACDSSVEEPARVSMDEEITALKARVTDPVRADAEYRAILARHGHAVKAPEAPVSPGIQAAEAALGKSAGMLTSYKTVKDFTFSYRFAYHTTLNVAAGSYINVSADRIEEPTDPVLVAFYKTGGSATAYTIRSPYFNDDRGDGTRNAYISWTNNTGAAVSLEILAFAYSYLTTGVMKITITGPGVSRKEYLEVAAYPEYTNSVPGPFEGCGSPEATKIRLQRLFGGGFMSGLFALNRGAMRGGFIRETSTDTQTLTLQDVLTNGSGSMLMGVMLDTDEMAYEQTKFEGIQYDRYTCAY